VAVNNFIPTIWAARLLVNLQKALVFGNLVNRDYEGEIANAGDTVKIGGIGAVTVGSYTKNSTSLSWQTLADASQTLLINQSKYFAFKVDDVDKIQTNVALIDAAMQEAAYAMADNIDQFIAGLHGSAATANKIGSDGGSAKVVGYGGTDVDPYKQLVDMGVVLDEANVPKAGRWAVLPAWYDGMLRKSSSFGANVVAPVGQTAMINGYIGRMAGFDLYSSNNVTDDGQSTKTYRIMFGTQQAISVAVQKDPKPEAVRLIDSFADGVRGLLLYGGTVVRPSALGTLYAKKGS
jgi:hypothetical protein